MHIEARIDQDRKTALALKGVENVVIERVGFAFDDLRTRRAIDVTDRSDALPPFRFHITSDGHETARIAVDRADVEDRGGLLDGNHRCKRHEFGTRQLAFMPQWCEPEGPGNGQNLWQDRDDRVHRI